jgi:hypothetical protein
MKPVLVAVLACLPGLAWAETVSYATADGRVFLFVGAEGDGVLYPEADLADVYTLTPDCSVSHDTLGVGEWHWANGGWVIEYGGAVSLGFPRQEAPFDAPGCAM